MNILTDLHFALILTSQFVLWLDLTLILVVIFSYCCFTNSTMFEESLESFPALEPATNSLNPSYSPNLSLVTAQIMLTEFCLAI